jgi:enamine deaminase RidA (YjgF/YER057c/UK114 family)
VKKEVIVAPKVPQPITHNPHAIKVGPYVFVSGLYATDFKTGIPVRNDPVFPFSGPSDIELQTEFILKNLAEVLRAAGTGLENVVKMEVCLENPKHLHGMDRIWREFFPKDPPARTVLDVGPTLLIPGALVEVYAIAVVPDGNVRKQVVQPPGVPVPTEHCSQAVRAGNFLFHSGLPATDFKTGIPVGKDPRFPHYRSNGEDQINYVLGNMEQCANAAGTSLQHAVKSQHYHVDRRDFHDIDRVWKQFMPVPPPRSSMQIKGFMVPGALTTANLITLIPDARHQKEEVRYDKQFHPSMRGVNFSPAIRAGDWIFLAGQVATDFRTPVFGVDPRMPYYGSDIEIQTEHVLRNLSDLLAHCGSSLEHVVDAHIYLLDTQDYRGFERVYRRMMPSSPPVMTVIPSTGIMFDGPTIEIDFIAIRNT